MVGFARCVVPYCDHAQNKSRACIYAPFPKDIDRCRSWLQIVGVEDLVHLPHFKLNKIRHVCGCHFTDEQFSNELRKRLKRTAIPTLIDSRVVPLSDLLMKEFDSNHCDTPKTTAFITEVDMDKSLVNEDQPMGVSALMVVADSQPRDRESEAEPSMTVDSYNKIDDAEQTSTETTQITKRYRPSDELEKTLQRITGMGSMEDIRKSSAEDSEQLGLKYHMGLEDFQLFVYRRLKLMKSRTASLVMSQICEMMSHYSDSDPANDVPSL